MKDKDKNRRAAQPLPSYRNTLETTGKTDHIVTDPDGSWTGVPEVAWEEPIQDVDDL